LNSDPEITVVGTANNGTEALAFVVQQKPDVITMDLNMPKMDGLEATRRIMETLPVPIIIVSANWDPQEVATTFRALEAGAIAGVEKPRGLGHKDFAAIAQQLIQTVKLMAEVKVVRRWPRVRQSAFPSTTAPSSLQSACPAADIRLIAIGASTGGPPVLRTILAGLPKNFPLPLVIVQHIAAGFLPGLVAWLQQASGFLTCVPQHGDVLLPGRAYLAPDGFHIGIEKNGRVILSQDAPENNLRPAVSYLFRSVARAFTNQAIGILLTGMGRDGAHELKLMKEAGAMTIAQDQESSVVHGMPGEAIKLGATTHVLPPERIAETLASLV
jgi:two-component system chemotaxis response regulator CheB